MLDSNGGLTIIGKREPPSVPFGSGDEQKGQTQCSGSARTLGVSGSFIIGLGITFSVGRATVNSSGAAQWYATIGLGAGFDLGVAGAANLYKSISSVAGYNDVLSGFFTLPGSPRSLGGQLAFDVNSNIVGGGLNATGIAIPGVRTGVSAASTQTVLFGGPCSG